MCFCFWESALYNIVPGSIVCHGIVNTQLFKILEAFKIVTYHKLQ